MVFNMYILVSMLAPVVPQEQQHDTLALGLSCRDETPEEGKPAKPQLEDCLTGFECHHFAHNAGKCVVAYGSGDIPFKHVRSG